MDGGRGTDPSDAELVDRARAGHDEAFGVLMRRHERRVYNLCYRMMGRQEDARDAAQDAFLSAYRRLESFRGDAAFTTWLHRIAVNACYDMLRKRRAELPLDEVPEPPAGPDPAEGASIAVDVQRALLVVPVEFRAALVLRDVHQLPYEEVAKILGVPIGTVKSRLHRGRVFLGRILAGQPEEPDELGEPGQPGEPSDRTTPSKGESER
jgi:RNA polymerase sigma-70 factor, ECF subfamily